MYYNIYGLYCQYLIIYKGGQSANDLIEMEEMANIVSKICSKREKLGLSQRDLARMCDIPQSTVARIETYKTSPTLETLIKITRELGLKVAVL